MAAKHQQNVWVAAAHSVGKKLGILSDISSAVEKDIVVAAFMDTVRHELVQGRSGRSAMSSDSPLLVGKLSALYSAANDMLPVSMSMQWTCERLTNMCLVWTSQYGRPDWEWVIRISHVSDAQMSR